MSSLAFAESREEYDAQVEAVEAKIFAAQEALEDAQTAYNSALATGVSLDFQIAQAAQNLANAQAAYDQSQIPDPSWVRPMVEEVYTVSVPYTTQVPYVVQEPVVTSVPTTTQVPQTTYTITGGVTAQMYNRLGYNNAPPLPSSNETPLLTTNVTNIDFQWGGGYILQQGNVWYHEDVIIKFAGNLMVPADGYYEFYAPGDDGVILNIAGMELINDWYDKGGGGSISEPTWIRTGILYPFTLYYYENGGGAWVQLNAKLVTDSNFQVVPASWLGTQVTETTTYQEMTTYTDVTTYVDVTYYREELAYRQEERTRIVSDENAIQPNIKDPDLLPAIESAQDNLDSLNASKSENSGIIESASRDVITAEQELRVAQQELEAIPPFREPTPTPTETESTPEEPTEPEPESLPEPEQTETPDPESESELRVDEAVSEIENLVEIDPDELTETQVEELVSAAMIVFETAEQGSEEYNQALEALAVAAQADDPQVSEELAAIPLLGDAAVVALEVFNNLGNVGADMSPQVREESEKTIIASVIAAGAAINAVSAAAVTATSSGGGAARRIN
jgi:tetratricopeptide (TPR) repeat protein